MARKLGFHHILRTLAIFLIVFGATLLFDFIQFVQFGLCLGITVYGVCLGQYTNYTWLVGLGLVILGVILLVLKRRR